MSSEEFRPVPGFPNYQVSNLGRVQSKRTPGRKSPDPDRYVWRDLKPSPAADGYRVVMLHREGKGHRRYIHRLVLEAFVGPCPNGMQARHVKVNDKTFNHLDNLCWGTPTENAADRKVHGTHLIGEACGMAKLSADDIAEMRRLREQGVRRDEIARRFGITPTHVSRAVLGTCWGHIAPTGKERQRVRLLGYVRGDGHHKSKLTGSQVDEIRRLHAAGLSGAELGRRFGITKSTACRIIRGVIWTARIVA